MTHSFTHKITVAALSAALLATPFLSFAQTTTTRTDAKFCQNIGTVRTALNTKLSERLDAAKAKNQEHTDAFLQKKETAMSNLQAKRADVEAKWQTHVTELRGRAKTDAQKAAVETFITTVNTLTTARHAAVDAAVTSFTDGVKALHDKGVGDFNTMISTYQSQIQDAFTKAQTSCSNGEDPSAVRAQLKTDLSAVRDSFKSDRAAHSYRTDFEALRTARVNAVTSAGDTFRTGFAQAKNALRDAFAASKTSN